MGLTFKENCPDLRNSKVADVVKELLGAWDFKVIHGQHPERPRKPDPGSLALVCSELGVSLAEAEAIEAEVSAVAETRRARRSPANCARVRVCMRGR